MNSNYAIPVHICSLCGKPFTQERQHQRHQAYCRKNQSRPRTRPRSCRACNQAKIKCNFRAPCNQCARKEVDCVYDQPRKELAVNDAPVRIDSPGSSSNSNGLESIPTSTLLGEMLDTDSLGLVHPGYVPDHGSDDLFAISATELDRSKHKDLHPIGDPPMPTALSSEMDSFMSLLQSDDFDFALHASTCKSLDFVPPVQPPTHLPIPGTEISTTAVHFSRNKIMTPAQQLFTSMLIDMIRAYPLMMTRRETFPPFVHPHCYLYEGCDTFPQVLTNCMGIAQLFVSCTDDTRPFVWTTVMTEVRSVMNKLGSMNKFELFSALQASLLYLIMRAIETETQQSAQDLELIRAHEIICDYTLQQIGTHTVPEVNDPRRQWKDWIFDESVKRVAWVWFSLSVVYYIRSGAPCKVADSTGSMPLPCTKTEWEAQTEDDWRREYYKARNSQTATSIQTFGDLVDAHRGSPADRLAKAKQLEAWNAGIDNLGVLLNLAVYMTRD